MRKKKIDEAELPSDNLAVYQLVNKESGGIIKDFALKLDVPPQTIQRLFKVDKRTGRYPSVTAEMKDKIANAYGLQDGWCEEMSDNLRKSNDNPNGLNVGSAALVKTPQRPRILNYAMAGHLSDELEEIKEYAPVNPLMPDYDCTIIIRGDSMEPTYQSGDEIALRDVTKTGFIQWGAPHVMDTTQGIVLKRLYDDPKGIKCVSDNKMYEPFVVPKSEVYHIYRIVGFVRVQG
jgi:SOS-response transcriptional repressor LexA